MTEKTFRMKPISMRDVMVDATIVVTLSAKRDWRITMGLWVIRFGAWLTGAGFRVDDE